MASKGFTLIEMLVVLAIMALIIGLVPPLLAGGQSRAEFTAAGREIQATLRETRSRAIGGGHTEAFMIDAASGSFRGGDKDRPRHVPAGIRLSLFAATDSPVAADEAAAASGDHPADEAPTSIRFFSDGSSTGGGVRLRQGRRRSDILVDWLTGRISVETGDAPAAR